MPPGPWPTAPSDLERLCRRSRVASSANFPLLNPLQSSLHGSTDAFVSKVNASGTLAYSTYLGGSGAEVANAIAVDSSGAGYIAGYTYSADLPVANAFQSSNAGDCDAFLARVSATGTLDYLTYLRSEERRVGKE